VLLTEVVLFFSKLAVVTFGGAYSVLAYMAQQAVEAKDWLSPDAMLDGLGLAETTPGPLILVTQFVGYQAGYGAGGVALAVPAALMTVWVTFAPCFLWIFAGAPYLDRITARPRLKAALSAITAAVVGVILNLTIWFALHVFFGTVTDRAFGPLRLTLPDPATLDLKAVGLAALAALLLLGLHRGMLTTLGLTAAAGLVLAAV
jgi:chromate transporter